MRFIDENKELFGVEPICIVMQFAPSSFYLFKCKTVSKRKTIDDDLKETILRIHQENYSVYGSRKMVIALNKEGISISRCKVIRLMHLLGIQGRSRSKRCVPKTTNRDLSQQIPKDLINRDFSATRPNEKWFSDITYVKTLIGWVYVAFVVDCYSRMIIGWKAAYSMTTKIVIDALEAAIRLRLNDGKLLCNLIHHSDRGSQYLSFEYRHLLEQYSIKISSGSKGDSYDNALIESLNGLYKTELIRNNEFTGLSQLQWETLNWVDWYNNRRIHSSINDMSPDEFEQQYYRML